MSNFGVLFNTAAGYRQIDQNRIVPQLIAKFDMSNNSYFDLTEADGIQPGWVMRAYQFFYPDWLLARPHILFYSIPTAGQDVWSDGARVMFRPGATFTPPVLYFFALDYVTKSSAAWGIRVQRPDGSVTYDSGNDHLNLSHIYGGINLNVNHDDTIHASSVIATNIGVPPRGMPAAPAISPQAFDRYMEFGQRFNGRGSARCGMFYRSYGGSLQALMLRSEYSFDESAPPNNSYSNFYITNPNNRTILLTDRYIYD